MDDAREETAPARPVAATGDSTFEEIADALARHVGPDGVVQPGVAAEIVRDEGCHGRLVDVLAVLTEDAERMGYLAGGRKAEEVLTWLPLWADSPLSVDEIRAIVSAAGWDPEPFVAVAKAGLLDALLRRPDGTPRRVKGELAGGWLSDQFALADDEQILQEVRDLVEEDAPAG